MTMMRRATPQQHRRGVPAGLAPAGEDRRRLDDLEAEAPRPPPAPHRAGEPDLLRGVDPLGESSDRVEGLAQDEDEGAGSEVAGPGESVPECDETGGEPRADPLHGHVAPPPQTCPEESRSRAAWSRAAGISVSASTKTRKRPRASRAPALRAREIWLTGSKTTTAPSARATAAVASVELLSQTTISPARSTVAMASFRRWRVRGRRSSSLKAGTTME